MASVLIVEDDGLVAIHMARALRDAGHTPVLVITGRREAAAKLKAPEGSVSDILLKPVSAAQLCRAVNVAFRDRREGDARRPAERGAGEPVAVYSTDQATAVAGRIGVTLARGLSAAAE